MSPRPLSQRKVSSQVAKLALSPIFTPRISRIPSPRTLLMISTGASAHDLLPALNEQRLDQLEGILRFQLLFVEGSHPNVQASALTADGRFRETRVAQFFRDR